MTDPTDALASLRTRAEQVRLQASWARSRDYGVHDDEVTPLFVGEVDTGSLLYECGLQVLEGLQATLANEPISLMMVDQDGFVLTRLCNDPAFYRSLDRVHLAPGFSYAEHAAGTNGIGLSLADRTPTLVKATEHYCTTLQGYTCAAAPVLDPVTGDLAGSVNLTTWSDSSSELLLALAQSAAGNTAALMAARAGGHSVRPTPKGEVYYVVADRANDDPCVSRAWRSTLRDAEAAIAAGRVIALLGEPGAGKSTVAAYARLGATRRARVLNARPPAGDAVDAWLHMWTPELRDDDTCVIVSGVDTLPAWAAGELAASLAVQRRPKGMPQPFVLTAPDYAAIPEPLAALVDTVVEVPALRERPEDITLLAHHFARSMRKRDVRFTSAATHTLRGYGWPGNVRQLRRVVREAARRTELIDVAHLAPEVFSRATHTLTRLEAVERDEIVRALTEPGTTVSRAAARLGVGRATVYRKIAQYDITVPKR
jgi:hypothetical protein